MPAYKSYCWALGTTSFRMVEFNRKIEQQLGLLKEFWALPQNSNVNWTANEQIQISYYKFLREKEFIKDKDAPNKAKDAREKTSGLVDLGIIDDERRLTSAGNKLLSIAEAGNFAGDNILQIASDSFVYFKQLLKLSVPFDSQVVRPYLVLAYILETVGEISKEEFTYLLPLAIDEQKTRQIIQYIVDIRNGNATVEDAILSVLLSMDNYREARGIFATNEVTEAVIQEVGMNRKSREYDKPYFTLYNALFAYLNDKTDDNAIAIFEAVKKLSGKARIYWKQYIFNTPSTTRIMRDGMDTLNAINLFGITDESIFKDEFFKLLHLFKAKSLLDDYLDLNRRYFKTSDTVLFQDDKVKLDIIPNCFFSICKDSLLNIAFTEDVRLAVDCDLTDISPIFNVSQEQIYNKVEELYGVQVRSLYDVQDFVDRERHERLNRMIDTKFTDETLMALMTMFEDRADSDIQAIVTNNADVPTIFEYVLAIVWYKISGRQGKVLDYMNLSLDADLLPITHAAGGHEDITYKYNATADYPAHTLLIEMTLANKTNQRRMEMEPVSRHLGDYMLSHRDEEAYCVFATTFLHINVTSDFRMRKNAPYYSNDGTQSIDEMKILPFQTSEIKTIIQKQITYAQLYHIFEQAYQSTIAPNIWYQQEIVNRL